jgi:two-component system, cell cycle response regulator DivK
LIARIATVLVVDDDLHTQEAYAEYLRLSGFAVVTAGNGPEGLEIARRALPDVILMDAAMPGMEGWTALKLLKADPRTRAIPVVVLTGHTQPADQARARDCGADAFLAKPCIPEELVRQLKNLVQRPPIA